MGILFTLLFAFVIYKLIRFYIGSKHAVYLKRCERAMRYYKDGERRNPSWLGDRARHKIFEESMFDLCIHNGVAKQDVQNFLKNSDKLGKIVNFCGLLETWGASFSDQISFCAEYIVNDSGLTPPSANLISFY
mgnify:CR=1 FL=1